MVTSVGRNRRVSSQATPPAPAATSPDQGNRATREAAGAGHALAPDEPQPDRIGVADTRKAAPTANCHSGDRP